MSVCGRNGPAGLCACVWCYEGCVHVVVKCLGWPSPVPYLGEGGGGAALRLRCLVALSAPPSPLPWRPPRRAHTPPDLPPHPRTQPPPPDSPTLPTSPTSPHTPHLYNPPLCSANLAWFDLVWAGIYNPPFPHHPQTLLHPRSHEALKWRRQLLVSLAFSAPLLLLAMAAMLPPLMEPLGE